MTQPFNHTLLRGVLDAGLILADFNWQEAYRDLADSPEKYLPLQQPVILEPVPAKVADLSERMVATAERLKLLTGDYVSVKIEASAYTHIQCAPVMSYNVYSARMAKIVTSNVSLEAAEAEFLIAWAQYNAPSAPTAIPESVVEELDANPPRIAVDSGSQPPTAFDAEDEIHDENVERDATPKANLL